MASYEIQDNTLSAFGNIFADLFNDPGIADLFDGIAHGFDQFQEVIANLFEGIPHEAKTISTGIQLMRSNEAIAQQLGMQMFLGGSHGRVLSESTKPEFILELAHVVGGFMNLANYKPVGSYWPAHGVANNHGNIVYTFNPVPPLPGSGFDEPVRPAVIAAPIIPDDQYEPKFGFPRPDPLDLHLFLQSTYFVHFGSKIVKQSLHDHNLTNVVKAWKQNYDQWVHDGRPLPLPKGKGVKGIEAIIQRCCDETQLSLKNIAEAIANNQGGGGGGDCNPCPPAPPSQHAAKPPPPPPPAPPEGGDDLTDEMFRLRHAIDGVTHQMQSETQSTDSDCCRQLICALPKILQPVISAIQHLNGGSSTTVNIDLKPLATAVDSVTTAIKQATTQEKDCCDETQKSLAAIADAVSTAGDPKPIVDAIDRNTAMHDVPQTILDKLFELKYLDPAFKGLLQGAPADWVDAVETAGRYVAATLGVVVHAAAGEPPSSAIEHEWRSEIANKHGGAMALLKDIVGIPPDAHVKPLSEIFRDTMRLGGDEMEPVIAPLVDAIAKMLTPAAPGTHCPGDVGVDPDRPISAAVGFALGAEVAAYIASFAGIDAGEPLAKLAELMAAAVGFEQLRDVKIGPLVREGIGKVAEMQARKIFRQTLPGYGALASWNARGIMDEPTARKYMALNGLCDALQNDALLGAQGGLNPRMLLQLVNTGLFTEHDIQDELQFAGVRPASQNRLLHAAPYLASRGEREALRSTLKQVYASGLFSDHDLTDQLAGAEHNLDRDNLTLQDARWKKLLKIVADLEAEYSTMFAGGAIDDATYRSYLAGLGLQQDMIDALAGKSEAKANAALIRREMAEARALEKATSTKERAAAVKNFQAGQLGLPQLAASLVATGLTPTQAAAWVSTAQAAQVGNQVHQYGLLLTPDDARLLRERVAALTDQRKRNLISDKQYAEQLRALKVTAHWIAALRSAANATLTPKKDAFVTPVETQN